MSAASASAASSSSSGGSSSSSSGYGLRVDPKTGRSYYQGAYVLKPWEIEFQSDKGDWMDPDLVTDWDEFPWKKYNWTRNRKTNMKMWEANVDSLSAKLRVNNRTDALNYMMFWVIPGYEFPLMHNGQVSFACIAFRLDVARVGALAAGVNFVEAAIHSYYESERVDMNWHKLTMNDWIYHSWRSLILEKSGAPKYGKYDADRRGVKGTQIRSYNGEFDNPADLALLLVDVRRTVPISGRTAAQCVAKAHASVSKD